MSARQGYTQASNRAVQKYTKTHMDQINLKYQKGFKDKIVAHTELTGEALAAFVRRAIEETIARDRAKMREGFKPEPIKEEE